MAVTWFQSLKKARLQASRRERRDQIVEFGALLHKATATVAVQFLKTGEGHLPTSQRAETKPEIAGQSGVQYDLRALLPGGQVVFLLGGKFIQFVAHGLELEARDLF